jgi:hypothetical protein
LLPTPQSKKSYRLETEKAAKAQGYNNNNNNHHHHHHHHLQFLKIVGVMDHFVVVREGSKGRLGLLV